VSDHDEKAKEELKGVAEEDALRKLLTSDEEEEEEKKEGEEGEEDEEEKKKEAETAEADAAKKKGAISDKEKKKKLKKKVWCSHPKSDASHSESDSDFDFIACRRTQVVRPRQEVLRLPSRLTRKIKDQESKKVTFILLQVIHESYVCV